MIAALDAPGAFSLWDIATLAMLAVLGALYYRGLVRLAGRQVVRPWHETAAFAAGWIALVAAVLPPLDSYAIRLFSVHMAQHELMMLVGAPLVTIGRPVPICLWGVPDRWRPAAVRVFQGRAVLDAWRIVTTPVIAWALSGLALWVWHVPALYDAAVASEGLHFLEHATFVGTSVFFWYGLVYGRYGRVGYGAGVFYVFATVVHSGILGALVTFARTPLYPIYGAPSAALGVDPVADQQVAGLLMWVPAGIILTLLGLALFAAWMGEAERRSNGAAAVPSHGPVRE
jgi:putative membrane protein